MNSRERVFAALNHQPVDRVPRFEIWIDGLFDALGQGDSYDAYANLGQDCVMLPSRTPPDSNAWRDGLDEFGRVWHDGMYHEGAVETYEDLARFSPPLAYVDAHFEPARVQSVRERHPDHCLIFGTHVGPFTAGYMAMGFSRFFTRLVDDPAFIHQLMEHRTQWCIALYQRALDLGAEVLVLGDDAAHRGAPMISTRMWREFVLPYHQRIVEALDAPVIWHSDGHILPLLPAAVEAGFVGVHGLEPAAGIDLGMVKREFGAALALIGNLDISVLFDNDLNAVQREVDRCMVQGAPGGGYMFATCNSIFDGMNAAAVVEMFRYAGEAADH